MSVLKPYFGNEVRTFAEALPDIEKFRATVVQDIWHHHAHLYRDGMNVYVFQNEAPPPPGDLRCVNPDCKRGGIALFRMIQTMTHSKETVRKIDHYSCPGDEGSPAGRRKGRDCDVSSSIEIEITYKKK